MKLVLLITSRIEEGLQVADAWRTIGAPGVSILRTHGLHTLQQQVKEKSLELPRMTVSLGNALAHLIDNMDETGELILSVMADDLVDNAIEKAQEFLGDLDLPHNGVLFVIDVERAIGLYDPTQTRDE